MSYDTLRHFADSYGLLFLALVAWTFRKGAKRGHERAARSIFESEDRQDG